MGLRRGGLGVRAVKRDVMRQRELAAKGEEMLREEMAQIEEHMHLFRERLTEFARKHRSEINRDPEFRRQFQRMTLSIGVDPLASSKGFWSELLGVGDFYFELGVQILDICISTRPVNGGLIEINDLMQRLVALRGAGSRGHQRIKLHDVVRAVDTVRALGNGFRIHGNVSKSRRSRQPAYIVSVPYELNEDHTAALSHADQTEGCLSPTSLADALGWDVNRCTRALQSLVAEGMAWVDDGARDRERLYWIPSLALVDRSATRVQDEEDVAEEPTPQAGAGSGT